MFLKKTDLFALLICFSCIYSAKAQVYLNPFSQYGLGEILPMNQVDQKGMGGTFYTQTDPNRYNFANPASYSLINYFSFEVGGNATFYNHTDGTTSFSNIDGGVPYISIAFPIDSTKKWGFSAGLMPYAITSYQFQTLSVEDGINKSLYRIGSGGLTRAYMGTSIRLFHNFYLGANASFIFGNEASTLTQVFPDSSSLYGVRQSTSNLTAGVAFDVGFVYNIPFFDTVKVKNHVVQQYFQSLKDSVKKIDALKGNSFSIYKIKYDSLTSLLSKAKDSIRTTEAKKRRSYTFQIGGTCNLPSYLPTTQTIDAYTYSSDLSISDSLAHYVNQNGYIYMPIGFGASFELASDQNWKIAVTGEYKEWSKYRGLGVTDSLNDYYSFGVGYQIQPRRESGNTLWTTTDYRIGFRYSQTPYLVNGTRVNDYRITFGTGIPIAQRDLRVLNRYAQNNATNWPYVDISLELGQTGSLSVNKLQQQYAVISLGFHLFEVNWFQKRKLD